MISTQQRVTKRLFSESFSNSKIASNDYLTLRYKGFSGELSKISVVVSKKVLQKATDRNTLKRRLYDIVLNLVKKTEKPYVLMVFPKKGATTLPFSVLQKETKDLLVKARII